MSRRPLALVSGLTLGDYLLWNWSLGANHDVLALVSGLTLPALAVAFVWLLVLNLARLLTRAGRGAPVPALDRRRSAPAGKPGAERAGGPRRSYPPPAAAGRSDPDDAAGNSSVASPGKLAA